jgi:hypothetical protein
MESESRPPRVAPPIAVERREHRLSIPYCPHCNVPPRVVSRTDYVVYVRCERCAHVRSIEKPGWTQAHAATTESQALRAHAEQVRETSRSLRERSTQLLNSTIRQFGAIVFGKRLDDDDSDS